MTLTWLLVWIVQAPSFEPATRAPAHELALEIRADRVAFHAGDEIPITFVVTNTGSSTYTFTDRTYDRSGRMAEYRLRADGERGAPVPDPRTLSPVRQGYIGGGLGTFAELRPGDRLSKTVTLNLWALVTAPGATPYAAHMTRGRARAWNPRH